MRNFTFLLVFVLVILGCDSSDSNDPPEPSSVVIERIELVDYSDPNSYDVTTYPDIYPAITFRGMNGYFWVSDNVVNNADPSNTHSWVVNEEISSLSRDIKFTFWDSDQSDDELVAESEYVRADSLIEGEVGSGSSVFFSLGTEYEVYYDAKE